MKCKSVIGMVVLTALFIQIFSRLVIIADYKINTRAYAANCENKQKPSLHCNGMCQMMKKLSQEERKEQQTPERKIEETFMLFCEAFATHSLLVHVQYTKEWGAYQAKNKIAHFTHSLLRPPILA